MIVLPAPEYVVPKMDTSDLGLISARAVVSFQSTMPIVQFAPFASLVQPSFWHELTSLKVDVLRLSDDAIPITATYTTGRSVKDRETGQEIVLGCNVTVGAESFQKDHQ